MGRFRQPDNHCSEFDEDGRPCVFDAMHPRPHTATWITEPKVWNMHRWDQYGTIEHAAIPFRPSGVTPRVEARATYE